MTQRGRKGRNVFEIRLSLGLHGRHSDTVTERSIRAEK